MTTMTGALDGPTTTHPLDAACLYAEVQPIMSASVRQVLGRCADVEDITHDAFLRLWHATRSGTTPIEAINSYAWQVARNTAVSHVRSASRARARDSRYAHLAAVHEADAAHDAVLTRDEVRSLLTDLPAVTRQLMWAADVHNQDLQALADEHGTTPGALAAHLYRARKGCRAKLAATS